MEDCDLVLKQFKQVLESIYDYYASHNPKIKPGMKKALSLDSLLLICKAAHLFDEVSLNNFFSIIILKGNVCRKRFIAML